MEVKNLRFVAGNGALTTAAFGDNEDLIITLPANEADYTALQSDIDGANDDITALQEALQAAVSVEGFRDDPESALVSLLTVLATAGLITDETEETDA